MVRAETEASVALGTAPPVECRYSVYVVRASGARECVDDRLTAEEARQVAAEVEHGMLEYLAPLEVGDRVETVEEPGGAK